MYNMVHPSRPACVIPSKRCRLIAAALDLGGLAGAVATIVLSEEIRWSFGCVQASAARAVVLPTLTVLPIIPILTLRTGAVSCCSCCFRRNPKRLPFFCLLLFLLPSLLPELPSGTLVNGRRIPGRSMCDREVVVEAVISPKGGRCEAYSSARLMRFFAHSSAMPSIAVWNSALSAARSISAKA